MQIPGGQTLLSSTSQVFLGPYQRTVEMLAHTFCYCSKTGRNRSGGLWAISTRKCMANNGGMMNVIRCDLKEYIVWKWCPKITESNDPGQRANFVRWGSSLRVKDGEMAIFVYRGSQSGAHDNQDVIMGPYDGTIESANLPVISKIVGLAYGGGQGGPFQAEIYFINLQH